MADPIDIFRAASGYQQAILLLYGVHAGGRFLVRSADRWYADAVAPLFRTRPYLQRRKEPGKLDYWTIKSAAVRASCDLSAVTDWQGFCRGILELQGSLSPGWRKPRGGGAPIPYTRLRLYGQPELLAAWAHHVPAAPKKIQECRTDTGTTHALYYQSRAEVVDILSALRGDPCSQDFWSRAYAAIVFTDGERRWLRERPRVQAHMREMQRLGVAAAMQLPGGQRGIQNRTSKLWLLVDPDGTKYAAINLVEFVRAHADDFDIHADDDRAVLSVANGFRNISRTLAGRNKGNPVSTCRQWGLACPSIDFPDTLSCIEAQESITRFLRGASLSEIAAAVGKPESFIREVLVAAGMLAM